MNKKPNDNIIKIDHSVLDYDECITNNILFRNLSYSDNKVLEPTETTTSLKESKTINILDNNIHDSCTNLNECITNDSAEGSSDLKSDSELTTFNTTNNFNNNEDIAEYIENIVISNDVISISSDSSIRLIEDTELLELLSLESIQFDSNDKLHDQNYNSDCISYHSSDFEFITESEAELEGLIDNRAKTLDNRTEFNENALGSSKSLNLLNYYTTNNLKPEVKRSNSFNENKQSTRNCDNDFVVPKTVHLGKPSCSNIHTNNISAYPLRRSSSYNLRQIQPRRNAYGSSTPHNIFSNDKPVHNAIPAGEEYFNLFRGIYDPILPLSDIHMMENKDFRTTGMNVEFEGIGFDVRLMRNIDGSQDEFETEAEKNAQKIINLYPGDNKKCRRH